MHFHSAIKPRSIASFVSAFLLALLIAACGGGTGGSDAGNQSDQHPPVADAAIIGLFPDTSTSIKTFSTRANNKLTLTGKNSRAPDVPIMTYRWAQISGEPVTLTAQTGDSSTFTTPNVATETELRFQLTVIDANDKTSVDTLLLKVMPVDDEDRFLANPLAPKTQLKILAALHGGITTGANDQPFSIQAVTIAHWRNRLGTMDQIEIHSQTRDSLFPSQFSPSSEYDPFTEPRNPQLLFDIESVDVDTINQHFDDSERDRRLELRDISSAYLEIRLSVVVNPGVAFELFALNDLNELIPGPSILSATPPTTEANNGALLQTWNSETSALITTDKLLAALGLENTTSANNYYLLLDPTAQFTRLNDWLIYAGFKDENGETSTDTSITHADYFNNYDLGYGRSTWMRKDANGNVFAYVINYPTVEDAIECHKDFSAFVMEYSDNPDVEGVNSKIIKFYAYVPDAVSGDYVRTNSINIDGRGEKMVPGVCTSCHQTNAAPSQFNSVADADLGAVFLPFDLDSFLYANAENPALIEPTFNASTFSTEELTKHSKETQEEAFRQLNLNVLATYTANPFRHSAAIELIHGWYGDLTPDFPVNNNVQKTANQKMDPVEELPENPFDGSYVQPGWTGQENLYRDVFSRNCRTCHVQLANTEIDFDTYDEFINSGNLISHVYEQGLMPLSRVTMDRFWVPFYGEQSGAELLRAHLEALEQTVPEAPGAPIPQFTFNPKIIDVGTQVVLDASGSNFASTYNWSLTAPNGSNTTLSNLSGLLSSFTPDTSSGGYDVTLTVTNDKNEQATLTQTITINDPAPVAECFSANTSSLTNEGLLAVIPVMDFISEFGDGGVTIESVTSGALGVATISQDGLTISYQLNDPFVRGVDTITYRLQDANSSLSASSPNCTSSPTAGFATITIDTTTAGTFAPGSPSALPDAIQNSSAIVLNWSAPTAVTVDGYKIYREDPETGLNIPLNDDMPITDTTFTDTGLTENTTYTYYIMSVIGDFESNPSIAITTTLSLTPTNLIATSISTNQIDLNWTAPPANLENYAIYRDGDSTPLTLVSSDVTSVADFSVTSGSQYTYTVTAIMGFTQSPPSNSVVGSTYPDIPNGLGGSAASDTQISVGWSPVNCNTGASYLVTPSPGAAFPTTSTTALISGLTPDTDYTFNVRAECNGLSSSNSSESSTITTQSIAPTGLTATSLNTNQVRLDWIPSSGTFDSYRIYRNGIPVTIISAAVPSHIDASLDSGTQYTYEVRAVAGAYESPASNSVLGATYPEAPTAPFAAPISDTEIDVNWAPVTCSTVPNYTLVPSADHGPITTNATGGTVGGLNQDTIYTFVVTAECHGLVSAPSPVSSPAKTFSLSPTNVTAIPSYTKVELFWDAAFGPVDEYLIYRDGELYGLVSGSQTSFEDMEVSGGSTFDYWVTALNGNTESPQSNTVTVNTVPDAPFNLSGGVLDPTSIVANWEAPSCDGELEFWLYNPDTALVIITTNTSHTLTGLVPSSFHDFTVLAVCDNLVSPPASTCVGTCP